MVLKPYIDANAPPRSRSLVEAVNAVFEAWGLLFGGTLELPVSYKTPYFVDGRTLTRTAGLLQIRDYATTTNHERLLASWSLVQGQLRSAIEDFHHLVTSASDGLDYFGPSSQVGF